MIMVVELKISNRISGRAYLFRGGASALTLSVATQVLVLPWLTKSALSMRIAEAT
jgi:hypothetical protein